MRVVCEEQNGISCPESFLAVVCGMDFPKQRGIREQRSEQGHAVNLLLTLFYSLEGCVFSLVARLSEARQVSPQYARNVRGREGEMNALRAS